MQPVPSPTSPETSVSIRFHPTVLETVRSAADAGLKSLPRRGAEIGGLLITSSPADPPQFFEEAALVSSEHRYGPGYHLSPRDIALLKATAAKSGERHGRRVAGFFRSCTGDAFLPSPNDLDVLRDELPHSRVLLLLKPFPDGHAIARVFQLRSGIWDQTAEFPITPERQAPRAVRVRTMPKPAVTLPVESRPAPAKKPHQFRSLWIYSLLGCLVLIFAIAYLGPRTPETTSLGLNVNPEGDLLRVTWNRNASVIRSGKDGVLRIDEGGQHQNIALSPGQLSSGAVLYRSNARDITFRLAVNGGTHAEETIRFVSGGAPDAPVASAMPATIPVSAPAPVVNTPVSTPPQRPKTAEVRTVNRTAPVPEKREKQDVAARPAPQPEEKTADRTAQAITPTRSQPIQDTTAPVAKPPEQQVSIPPVTPQAAQNTQAPPSRPQAPPVQEKTWEPIKSVMHYFNDPAVSRPTPVKEVQPKTKSVHGQPAQVRVLVAVDPHGGVAGAESLERAGADPELVAESVAAARRWKFQPARDHGKNVAATYTITFRFPSDQP